MLQQTSSSEVIIIQLQINLNSKIQLNGLGTNEIEWHKTTRNMPIIKINRVYVYPWFKASLKWKRWQWESLSLLLAHFVSSVTE